MRRCAALLLRHVAGGHEDKRARWAALLQLELEHIPRDREALVWAIGCAWASSVERYISKARPLLTCTLLLLGLYITTHYLLAHLSWYGLALRPAFETGAPSRTLAKFTIFLMLTALVCLVTPGAPRRRIVAAVAFPLFAMMTLAASRAAFDVTHALTSLLGSTGIGTIARVALFGTIMAALLSLPFSLAYRGCATALAALALIPALARLLAEFGGTGHAADLLSQAAPFACSLSLITVFSSAFNQWIRRPSLS